MLCSRATNFCIHPIDFLLPLKSVTEKVYFFLKLITYVYPIYCITVLMLKHENEHVDSCCWAPVKNGYTRWGSRRGTKELHDRSNCDLIHCRRSVSQDIIGTGRRTCSKFKVRDVKMNFCPFSQLDWRSSAQLIPFPNLRKVYPSKEKYIGRIAPSVSQSQTAILLHFSILETFNHPWKIRGSYVHLNRSLHSTSEEKSRLATRVSREAYATRTGFPMSYRHHRVEKIHHTSCRVSCNFAYEYKQSQGRKRISCESSLAFVIIWSGQSSNLPRDHSIPWFTRLQSWTQKVYNPQPLVDNGIPYFADNPVLT